MTECSWWSTFSGCVCTLRNVWIELPFECVQWYEFMQNSTDFILTVIHIVGDFLNLIPILVRIHANLLVNCEWNPTLFGYLWQHSQPVLTWALPECWYSTIPPGLHSVVFLLKPHFSGNHKALDRSAWCGFRAGLGTAQQALPSVTDCPVIRQGWCGVYCSFSSPPNGWIWHDRFRWIHQRQAWGTHGNVADPSFGEITELSGNRAKRFLGQPAILNRFWQRCQKRSGAFPCFSMKRSEGNEFISSRSAVLSNRVPGPVYLRRIQPLGGSHIRCVVVACFSETVSNWTVIQFSNWHSGKTIEGLRYNPAHHRRCPVWAFKS